MTPALLSGSGGPVGKLYGRKPYRVKRKLSLL
jgi:hypothetical protein